jgi:hypothetical protein
MITKGSLLSPRPHHRPGQRLHLPSRTPSTSLTVIAKLTPNNNIVTYLSRHRETFVWMRKSGKRKFQLVNAVYPWDLQRRWGMYLGSKVAGTPMHRRPQSTLMPPM